jgi:catechol 2,3-dioxygenase-like lactoylglutathione lyase family enzyme
MALPRRPISHVSYAVANLERAVDWWSSTLGAGPFFLVPHVAFDELTHHGEPCVWDHSAAFGQWGTMAIELQELHACDPPALTELLVPAAVPVFNHVAYLSPTPEADSAELAAAGHALFLHGKTGALEIRFHDTRATLGQPIEIHRDGPGIRHAFGRIAEAAQGWDGGDALRPMDWVN